MKKNIVTIIISVVALAIIGLGVKFMLSSDNNKDRRQEEVDEKLINCEYEGDITLGSTFEKDNYLYTYVELDNNGSKVEGWNIKYTDINNLEATKVPNCEMVGNKPIVSTEDMFAHTSTLSIDISEFNTKNVVNMRGMFSSTLAKEIIGLDKLNTNKVTDMSGMFYHSYLSKLDLSSFDTSNVLNMNSMFEGSQATEFDLTSFNTSKVYNMNKMFKESVADVIDVSNFDISNVIYMDEIFDKTSIKMIDVGPNKAFWDTKLLEGNN